jgi:chaperonin GroEL
MQEAVEVIRANKYGADARARILAGVQQISQAVCSTLGPAGRWVLFDHQGLAISTKDGVTVAREINLPDQYENLGARMVKAAAGQAVDEAGDGTTTATLLCHAIYEAGCKAIDEGAEPVQLVRGIERAVKDVVGNYDLAAKKFSGGILESLAVPCSPELAFQAARISANGDEGIARVVSEAVLKVGVDGALTIGDSYSQDHSVETVEGMQIKAGYAHPYLITDVQRNRAVYERVTVCLIDNRINNADEASRIMQAAIMAAKGKSRPYNIIVFCNEIDKQAMENVLTNKLRRESPIPIVVVQTPLWGDARRDLLEDIAILTEAQRIESGRGKSYEGLTANDFGYAEKVVVTATTTILTASKPSEFYVDKKLNPYLDKLRTIINDTSLRPDQIDAAKGRLAALTGGVAEIKVGGTSIESVRQVKFQVEDAIHATRAAVSEGVVPGGGSALLFAGEGAEAAVCVDDDVTDEGRGYWLLLGCLQRPIMKIAENAGHNGEKIVQQVKEANAIYSGTDRGGFDAATGAFLPDMIDAGIVDPLRVVRAALNSAASAASVLLKTEAILGRETTNQLPVAGR